MVEGKYYEITLRVGEDDESAIVRCVDGKLEAVVTCSRPLGIRELSEQEAAKVEEYIGRLLAAHS